MTETKRIEFKRELTRDLDIEREVVAFLNYREGGVIYIGVDDNGTPIGIKDIELVESLGSGITRILQTYSEITTFHPNRHARWWKQWWITTN